MPSSVVFLGPSLEPSAAAALLDTRYLPPIRRGDVDALLADGVPDAIGIVDGQFFQSFSISPKEILKAMEAGARVFGSSSMGALRAVELAPYGMVGVGKIYSLFASGELEADDEVALVYDPETLRPLSDPLVNIRLALETAVEQGVVSDATRTRFIDEAKRLYYPERSFARLLRDLAGQVPEQEERALGRFLDEQKPDAKRSDAIDLLRRMKEYLRTLEGDD